LNEPSLDEPHQPTSTTPNSPTSTMFDFESKGRFEPAPPPSPSITIPEYGPPKTSKWAGLPPHEPSGHMRVAPTHFGDEATPDE
jgi:hypothetical protein